MSDHVMAYAATEILRYGTFITWLKEHDPNAIVGMSNSYGCPIARYLRKQGYSFVRVQPDLIMAITSNEDVIYQRPATWVSQFSSAIDRIFDWSAKLAPRAITAQEALVTMRFISEITVRGKSYPCAFDPSIPAPRTLP